MTTARSITRALIAGVFWAAVVLVPVAGAVLIYAFVT